MTDYKTMYECLCSYTRALTEDYNKLLSELRYDPSQPRDEKGRFSSKSGGSVDNGGESDIIKSEIENIGISGKINIPPKQIDADKLSFDDNHINNDNARNISEKNAKNYVKTAKVSITKWNGDFENYYSPDGASFVDVKKNSIRTAFTKNEYTEKVNKMMEVFDKYGK